MVRVILEQAERRFERKTMITIQCNDGTTRVITSLGIHTQATATELAKDLEGRNYKSVQTKIL